jgi:ABC-2 type transport system ATP-binding protein
LQRALTKAGFKSEKSGKGLNISSAKTDEIGKLAHAANLTLLELSAHTASLEEAFLELTEGKEEFQAGNQKEAKK